jgi:hypothetical protein
MCHPHHSFNKPNPGAKKTGQKTWQNLQNGAFASKRGYFGLPAYQSTSLLFCGIWKKNYKSSTPLPPQHPHNPITPKSSKYAHQQQTIAAVARLFNYVSNDVAFLRFSAP